MVEEERPSGKKCFYCGESIFFDGNSKTPTGSYIPYEAETGLRHYCRQYQKRKIFGDKPTGSGLDVIEDSNDHDEIIEQRPLDFRD